MVVEAKGSSVAEVVEVDRVLMMPPDAPVTPAALRSIMKQNSGIFIYPEDRSNRKAERQTLLLFWR